MVEGRRWEGAIGGVWECGGWGCRNTQRRGAAERRYHGLGAKKKIVKALFLKMKNTLDKQNQVSFFPNHV
jgi:hypothetical protein